MFTSTMLMLCQTQDYTLKFEQKICV